MNNNGSVKFKTLIMIPILLVLLLLIVDTFISYLENKTYKKDTEKIITEIMNRDDLYNDEYYDEIKKLYEQRKYDTDMLLVEVNDDEIYLENEQAYFGLFSSLKTYNYNTKEVKILGLKFNVITSFKKLESKYSEINILGVKFKFKKGSKSFIKVTAKKNNKIEFTYTK